MPETLGNMCVICGNKGHVTDSRPRDGYTYRRRKCSGCGRKWSTVEIGLKSYEALRDQSADAIIEQLLLDDTSMETHEAVAYSLLARHYKRVAAHLSNIATAVRGRLEDLDFVYD